MNGFIEGATGSNPTTKPVITKTSKPVITKTSKPVITKTSKPVITKTSKPVITKTSKPVTTTTAQSASATNTKNSSYYQRLSNPDNNSNAKKFTGDKQELAGVWNSCVKKCDNSDKNICKREHLKCITDTYSNPDLKNTTQLQGNFKNLFVNKLNCNDERCLGNFQSLLPALNDLNRFIA